MTAKKRRSAPRRSPPPPPEQKKPEASPPAEKKNRMVSRSALINSLRRTVPRIGDGLVQAGDVFNIAEFPPEVVSAIPKSARMAMDDFGGCLPWAGANIAATYSQGLTFLGYPFLAELSQRPEYRRAVEMIATEMTRKWIKLGSVSEDQSKSAKKRLKKLDDALKRLRVKDAFQKMAEVDGFFGRSHLFVDVCDVDDRKELKTNIGDGRSAASKRKVGKGSLRRIKPVEPVWCYPTMYNSNDPLKPNWYRPGSWFVMGKEVHSSRFLTFIAREVPDLLKPTYAFGGLPLTQMMLPYVNRWLTTVSSVSDLIKAFTTYYLKTDLSESLQEDGDEMFERADIFNNTRSNRGLLLLDKNDEDVGLLTASLASLDLLQAQSQEHCASVAGLPLVKYTGLQPAGLNASSEGEIRVFYDWINACQEKFFRAHLTTVVDFVQLSEFGDVDPDVTFAFEPLWSLDEKSHAEKRKTEADTDAVMIESGVVSEEEARQRIVADPTSPYANIDPEDVPERPLEETGKPFAARKTVGAETEPNPGEPKDM